jgi:bifunctional non-homologous end joining protein LigD
MLRRNPVPQSSPRSKSASAEEIDGVRITHPDRVVFQDAGITKRDLAEYCVGVAKWMLPHLVHRPLTLVRCPEGTAKPCFYQKQPPQGLPDTVKRMPIRFKEGTSVGVYVEDLAGLLALIQFGVLEVHVWQASIDDIERPDRIVFDLDPGEGVAYSQVVDAALLLRERLEALKLVSFCRTTGGHGLHIVTPLSGPTTWAQARAFSKGMAEDLSHEAPQRFVATVSKEARRGRILIDWLRNGLGATAVASYSPRAREGATVAAPLAWTEVTPALDPRAFTVRTMPTRLSGRGADAWAGYEDVKQAVPGG